MQVRYRMIRVILSMILAALLAGGGAAGAEEAHSVDFAASVALDMSSETVKAEARVHSYVDGDTTHFAVSDGAAVQQHISADLKEALPEYCFSVVIDRDYAD